MTMYLSFFIFKDNINVCVSNLALFSIISKKFFRKKYDVSM